MLGSTGRLLTTSCLIGKLGRSDHVSFDYIIPLLPLLFLKSNLSSLTIYLIAVTFHLFLDLLQEI